MGLRTIGFVGPQNLTDGNYAEQPFRFGSNNELILSQNHGKWFEATARGNMWFTSAAAMAIPVDTALSTFPTLWNPAGSGVCLEIVRLQLTCVTSPNAPTALEWFYAKYAGAEKGTLGAMTVFTNIPPVNMLPAGTGGRVGKARYAQVVTWTVGQRPVYLMGTGISQDTWDNTQTNPGSVLSVDYDGMLVLAPSTALCLVGTVATTSTYYVNIYFIESPYSGMGA